ncbi:MAG: protoglobin domain-containing protein [Pirellulaceae bacterium]
MTRRIHEIAEFYEKLKNYVNWTEDDRQRVRRAWLLVELRLDDLIDDFYQTILRYDFTRKVLTGGESQIQRLRVTLREWLRTLFHGPYDAEFALSRWQVGIRHVEIGLRQGYAIAALARLRSIINQALAAADGQLDKDSALTLVSINKALDIDLALIDLAYQQSAGEQLEHAAAEKLQQSERLASIGQMVTGLAHESRNALQRSHACLETLLLDIQDRPDAMRQANQIQAALDHLHMLYEQVRNYAAPIVLDREDLDLEKLISLVWDNLNQLWSNFQTQVEFRYRGVAPCIVHIDRYRMDQVLTNLFQNAIEAAGTQGKVRCTASCLGENRVEVSIEDDGSGVPAELAGKIFDPFFTTKTRGTGLGLAIAQRIVEAHNGKIQLSMSELGGAKFTFALN